MEASLGHLNNGQHSITHEFETALVVDHRTSHSVTVTRAGQPGGRGKGEGHGPQSTSDTYTNSQGDVQIARHDVIEGLQTRDDLIHEKFRQAAASHTVRNGNTSDTHTVAVADKETTDHAVITNKDGSKTTKDVTTDQDSQTVASSQTTSANGKSETDATSATLFTISADGTIKDFKGNVITLHETGEGVTVTTTDSESSSTSHTDVEKKVSSGNSTEIAGQTVTDSKSSSVRDSETQFEAVLSQTTSGGKTTTQYIDYTISDVQSTTSQSHTVDNFDITQTKATQASGKPSGTTVTVTDASSDSATAISTSRTDDRQGGTDHISANSSSVRAFDSQSASSSDNGAVKTVTTRDVAGTTTASSTTTGVQTTSTKIDRDGKDTTQKTRQDTNLATTGVSVTEYDAVAKSQSSNGASSVRTDDVTATTNTATTRAIHYYAVIRTVVSEAKPAGLDAAA